MTELGKHSYSTRLANSPYTDCSYYRFGHIFCSQCYITTDVMTDIERHRSTFRNPLFFILTIVLFCLIYASPIPQHIEIH